MAANFWQKTISAQFVHFVAQFQHFFLPFAFCLHMMQSSSHKIGHGVNHGAGNGDGLGANHGVNHEVIHGIEHGVGHEVGPVTSWIAQLSEILDGSSTHHHLSKYRASRAATRKNVINSDCRFWKNEMWIWKTFAGHKRTMMMATKWWWKGALYPGGQLRG